MRRKMIIMLLVGAMTLSVAGCGAKEEVKNDVSVKVESTADNVSDSKTSDTKENDNNQMAENKSNAVSEPIDMTKTEVRDVVAPEQKEYFDISMDLPVVSGSEVKYENGENCFRVWERGKEYYNLFIDLQYYNNKDMTPNEIMTNIQDNLPNTYDAEIIVGKDGSKFAICLGYSRDTEDPEMNLIYRYCIYDSIGNYCAVIEYFASIDKSLHDAGMNLKNSSATEYEKVLREAIKDYLNK